MLRVGATVLSQPQARQCDLLQFRAAAALISPAACSLHIARRQPLHDTRCIELDFRRQPDVVGLHDSFGIT